jgi:hypothetical protein
MTATSTSSASLVSKTVTTVAGVTHIDLDFSAAMAKGRGTIFVTDGAVQTVIDRVTGEPKLRVVGATVTREISLDQVSISGTHVSFDATGLAAGKHYSIYMGVGTLQSGGSPFAGYTVPNQVAFDIAAAPPALSASFSFENTTLQSGQDIVAFVTLSRAVGSLNASAFSAENAAVLSVTPTDNPLLWKVVLTRSGSVADAENVLRLDMTKVEITPGVHGSGVATSPAYAVDTVVSAWVSQAGSGWDTGASDTDNLVNHTSPYIMGELHGGLNEGEFIELSINGVTVDPERISVVRETSPWFWSYSPGEGEDEPYLHEGANTIVVRVKDADAHSSATHTSTITVDTVAPEIDYSPDGATALPLNADIVITFREPLYWTDEESDMMPISVYCAEDDSAREVWVDASAFLDGGSMLTLDPGALGLEAGKHYELRLPDYLTDYAGNSLAEAVIGFQTSGTPDLTGPSATHAIVDGSLFYRAGQTITFRIKFDEAICPASDAILWVGLSNGYRADIASIEGDEATFTYTVGTVDADIGNLFITDTSLLVDNIEDLAGNPLTSAHIVFDGIHQYLGYGYGYLPVNVVVDTVAPDAPPAPTVKPDSDSGELGDDITADRTPTLKGIAEARAWVGIYKGITYLGGARADADGNWEATINTELPGGVHSLTVRQIDRAGNESTGTAYSLTIDYSAERPSTPMLANDTGSSASDRITHDPTLKGSGAEAYAQIQIMRGTEVVGYGSSDEDGNWQAEFGVDLPDGEHTVTVRQIDRAGNTSADSAPITFTLDTTRPAAPSGAPDLAAASDSGVSDSDNVTNDNTPTFTGSGALPNSIVVLYANEVEVGRRESDASGNWSITSSTLLDNHYSIAVKQLDAAGNQSSYSASLDVVIDTIGPSLVAALANQPRKEYQLGFNEAIRFTPAGFFQLKESDVNFARFESGNNFNWVLDGGSGGESSVLNLNVAASGRFKLEMNSNAITDLAGNVAVIGTPVWNFDL